jgi:hypothetical protein
MRVSEVTATGSSQERNAVVLAEGGGILFLRRRKKFVSELFGELNEAFVGMPIILKSDPGRLHYVAFRNVVVEDTLFSRVVSISFTLQDQQQPEFKQLQDLVGQPIENDIRSFKIELRPGTEVISAQTFFFTFTSFESVQRNLARFRSFIEDVFVSEDAARQAYRKRYAALEKLATETFGEIPMP